jgi:hypothetical protein
LKVEDSRVLAVLARDEWHVIERVPEEDEAPPAFLRFRGPLVKAGETGVHVHLIEVLWPYAEEESGELPSDDDIAAMEVFEERLCDAWEHDGHGFLAAVLTFDGSRQWVFYVRDTAECVRRLEAMPHEDELYPIELSTKLDPDWSFLHDELLLSFREGMDPEEWKALTERPLE